MSNIYPEIIHDGLISAEEVDQSLYYVETVCVDIIISLKILGHFSINGFYNLRL